MSPSVNSQTSTVPLPSQERCAPEITVISRFASIPIISSSLSTIDDTLVSNSYTRFTYCTAKGLSTTAYNITTPLQVKLAPIICRADNFANKAVDVVESRCPYPFKAKPEEVARLVRDRRDSATKYVRERRESAVSVASKTIDEKVKLPVVHAAQGIDQRFAPLVDYIAALVQSQPPNDKYQYQRMLTLTMSLKDNILVYSNEQLKQLQEHNSLVRRAMETAQAITDLASSSLTNANSRVHALSDRMLQELQTLQRSTGNLPSSLSASFNSASSSLSCAITNLRGILAEPIPLNQKVARVSVEVKERVNPLLENLSGKANGILNVVRTRADDMKGKDVNRVNGHAGRQ